MANSKTQIYVSPLTVIYIILALFLGRFSFVFFHFFCSFIHEMSHVITSRALKKEVREIAFLPIGFFARIDELEDMSPWKQIIILLAGPFSYFISNAIIVLLYRYNLLSIYGFNMAKEANLMILIFNLIPIIPLDGGRVIKALLLKFFPCHRAYKISIYISLIVSIFIVYLCIINTQYLILGFLIFDLLKEIIVLKRAYLQFLIRRLKKNNNYPDKVHKNEGIYTFKKNWRILNTTILDEKQLVAGEIKRVIGKKGI